MLKKYLQPIPMDKYAKGIINWFQEKYMSPEIDENPPLIDFSYWDEKSVDEYMKVVEREYLMEEESHKDVSQKGASAITIELAVLTLIGGFSLLNVPKMIGAIIVSVSIMIFAILFAFWTMKPMTRPFMVLDPSKNDIHWFAEYPDKIKQKILERTIRVTNSGFSCNQIKYNRYIASIFLCVVSFLIIILAIVYAMVFYPIN